MRSVPVLVEIGHLAGYKALNAHAGRVGDGDVLFVEHGTAEDVILAAEHRAVEVDLGDDLLGAGQLHSGVDRDLCFQHTADHALHAVDLGSGGMFKKDALTEFFDEVRQKCTFQYWFFGHYHSNMVIEKRYAMLYEQIIRLK